MVFPVRNGGLKAEIRDKMCLQYYSIGFPSMSPTWKGLRNPPSRNTNMILNIYHKVIEDTKVIYCRAITITT